MVCVCVCQLYRSALSTADTYYAAFIILRIATRMRVPRGDNYRVTARDRTHTHHLPLSRDIIAFKWRTPAACVSHTCVA